MKNIPLKIVTILMALAVLVSSCTKDDVTPVNQTQGISLNFNPVVDSSALNFTSSYTTDAGTRYTLSMFRYYVSNIRLVKSDGSEYPITGKYLLVNPSVVNYDLGQVPVGDYKGIKFAVGIDSATNHGDPTLYEVSNPLAIQSPAIHWSWNAGYVFMMMEGSVDTTVSNSDVLTYGQYSHAMFFHIGMDMLLRTVDLTNSAFTVKSDAAKQINIRVDINKVFNGIDLKTENKSHTMGTMPLATKVADNIASMFTIVQ